MAHAFAIAGSQEAGIEAALAYVESELGLEAAGNADVIVLRFELLSVDEARALSLLASAASVNGRGRAIIIAANRTYEPSQNALLKLLEEPPDGVTFFLVVPTMGDLLPTVRSRVTEIPLGAPGTNPADEFLALDPGGRAKYVAKLLERAKADKDEEKRKARIEARHLLEGITRAAHAAQEKEPSEELALLLADLDAFIPVLHDSSAPLKLIFEHLLIVIPDGLRA